MLVLNQSEIPKKDVEVDWSDRLKQWRDMSSSQGAIIDYASIGKSITNSVSASVISCMQAPFSSKDLSEKVEHSLVIGLRRSAGLNLLNFAMGLQL